VADARRRAGLVEEPRHGLGVRRHGRQQDLDGGLAPDDGMLGEIDDAHPPLAQFLDDPIIANLLAHVHLPLS
jgi:hypothetical protein